MNGREGVRDGSVPAGQGPEDGGLGIWRPSAAAAAAGSRLIVAPRDRERARGARENHEQREYAAGGTGEQRQGRWATADSPQGMPPISCF
jgi:hypothetical protein